jgi:phosphate-selective porin OprO/OprP
MQHLARWLLLFLVLTTPPISAFGQDHTVIPLPALDEASRMPAVEPSAALRVVALPPTLQQVAQHPVVSAAPPVAAPGPGAASFSAAVAGDPQLEARLKELEGRIAKMQTADEKRKEVDSEKKAAEATKVSVKFTGEFQLDQVMVSQDPANKIAVGNIDNFVDFRRARLGAQGDWGDFTSYRFEMDFAQEGRPSFLDVWLQQKQFPLVGNIKVGHFFEPFSLERLTSNRHIQFMERSLTDTFAPSRNTGVCFFDHADNLRSTWALGTFRTDSDNYGADVTESGGQSVTGRVTWLPYWDEVAEGRYFTHVGAAYSFREARNKRVRFVQTPEVRPGAFDVVPFPVFVNTGLFNLHNWQLFGSEAVLVHGPFSLESEYIWVPVDQIGGPDLFFSSWYVQASFFLTGECRHYNRETATFDRLHPFENFFRVRGQRGVATGLGAWQVAFRVSHIDLDSYNIRGGNLLNYTLGVNWYWNPHTRLYFNYLMPRLDSPKNGVGHADFFAIRAMFEF